MVFPLAPLCAEPVIVEVMFRNPLKVALVLSHLSLLWRFTADGGFQSQEKTTEELSGDVLTNEETLAHGVSSRHRSKWVDAMKRVLILKKNLFHLQMAQKDDIVTTETIQEFHIGQEETKMVS